MIDEGELQTLSWRDNELLSALRKADVDYLIPYLKPFSSPENHVLYSPGDDVETVYFPCRSTLVSFVVETEDGNAVETMMVGREGAVGGIVSHGKLPAYSRIMVQFGGDFLTLPVAVVEQAKKQSKSVESLFSRYADCMLAQIFQSTACNALHSLEQRMAKWTLAATDRTSSLDVPLTQERLASMLGVGRSYVSRVINALKREKIIAVRRGHIQIVNLEALRQRSCHCDEHVKKHFEDVLAGVYPRADLE